MDKADVRDLSRYVDLFKDKKICVIGDIIADVYIFGRPYRLSREAPVVVVKYEEAKTYPGSAGNTINNLLSLGADVYPLAFIGNDGPGSKMMDYFSRFANIDTSGIIRYEGATVTKTRILAGDTNTSKQQVIRIDRDDNTQYSRADKKRLISNLKSLSESMDAFIISDYGHGTVDAEILKYLRVVAKNKIVVGDSRYNLKSMKGITLITPNESEAFQLSGLNENGSIEEAGKRILRSMSLGALLITRGNRGMSLFLKNGTIHHIPISGKDDVTDVTGAGDTVCAVSTLSLAGGADFLTASRVANYAAGVVVMKRGTATVNPQELKTAIRKNGNI
ncbi:MAG TPA: PfkB family carbohydrate kinase [Syntrophorhabdaceae bacterium]|nr:PfkB family carbohydrate kinase [Syntrophorhabdaceae bacterium]